MTQETGSTDIPGIVEEDDPPIRVMALHALAYCERLFYLEEVEEIRVADDAVFAGRELHTCLAGTQRGRCLKTSTNFEYAGSDGVQ
jgi:CRISPR-associated protein Cas1